METQLGVYEKAQKAAEFCLSKIDFQPEIGLVLGSGLGDFADQLENKVGIPFEDVPYFKKSTVVGHAGKLVFGTWQGKKVVAMQGRYHFYEGHSIQDVVFPIRTLKLLGIKRLILTNAAGGVNQMLNGGDLMIIKDHINNLGTNPLIGPNDDRFGPRFPDMTNVYHPELRQIIKQEMKKLNIAVKEGVYIAFTGPSYETASEIKMAGVLGADAAGMSTVPEAIVANHMGIQVAGISCITNMCTGISKQQLSHKEVVETANLVKEDFKKLLGNLIVQF